MNEAYAAQIAREWNVPASGSGYVTRFDVQADYLQQFEIQNAGAEIHNELWVPAEELETFNDHIAGTITVTRGFFPESRK